ncbi:MAG: alkaline phosphatase family protein [Verrucomicrobia bacterium]|nr:MAG: alkaline phosphatase family protein [Verrucomicrobiota bacterium]
MPRVAVLNVVGLTPSLVGPRTPRLAAFAKRGHVAAIDPALPAVTCTAQSDYLTGRRPSVHGIVANGWYDRSLAEVHFWKQSNHLVAAPKVWDELRGLVPGFTCAKMFWWYNMYSTADFSVTPRPMYPADGRKFFDVYSWPYALRPDLKAALGDFPFPTFWGPAAGIQSPQGTPDAASRWIAASARWIEEKHRPTLNLVYLPHLDYNLQRLGPHHPAVAEDLGRIDAIAGDLIDYLEARGVAVIVLSEYGITPVDTPIHLNREFRKKGWITVREELGLEVLDAGNSRAFAVADHQSAHIQINDPGIAGEVRALLESIPGVAEVHGAEGKRRLGLDHPRAGDLVAFSRENAWFTYYYWLDDAKAPDFARCVDIHRKPGYDPVELFLDPAIPAVKLRILAKLLRKKLGFRMLMDVIPLDATLVRGSHGCRPKSEADWPMLVSGQPLPGARMGSTDVYAVIRAAVLG